MTRKSAKKPAPSRTFVKSLEIDLLDGKNPLIGNEELQKALGYVSMSAFRQALYRKTVPVPVLSLPNQRGKFALARDVAAWLSAQRDLAVKRSKSRRK